MYIMKTLILIAFFIVLGLILGGFLIETVYRRTGNKVYLLTGVAAMSILLINGYFLLIKLLES